MIYKYIHLQVTISFPFDMWTLCPEFCIDKPLKFLLIRTIYNLAPHSTIWRVICFSLQGFPQILKGISLNPYTTRYLPPFEEFEVDCCVIPQAASLVFPSVAGPSLFLFISGNGTLSAGFSKEQIVEEGEVLFVPAYMEFTIASQSKELHLYRAGVNSSFFQAFWLYFSMNN